MACAPRAILAQGGRDGADPVVQKTMVRRLHGAQPGEKAMLAVDRTSTASQTALDRPATGGPLSQYMASEHVRLEALLDQSVADPERFDLAAFEAFRAELLRHIGIEEKILLADARRRRGGEPLPDAKKLRMEHGALASLLVPTPDHALVQEIRTLLGPHDAWEEGPGGLYETCERLAAQDVPALLERVKSAPPVPVAAHFDGEGVHRTAAGALRGASRRG
jgi:hypothetical protein